MTGVHKLCLRITQISIWSSICGTCRTNESDLWRPHLTASVFSDLILYLKCRLLAFRWIFVLYLWYARWMDFWRAAILPKKKTCVWSSMLDRASSSRPCCLVLYCLVWMGSCAPWKWCGQMKSLHLNLGNIIHRQKWQGANLYFVLFPLRVQYKHVDLTWKYKIK